MNQEEEKRHRERGRKSEASQGRDEADRTREKNEMKRSRAREETDEENDRERKADSSKEEDRIPNRRIEALIALFIALITGMPSFFLLPYAISSSSMPYPLFPSRIPSGFRTRTRVVSCRHGYFAKTDESV
ncbi:unnamed protein product [Camellia sinensis]